MVIILLVISLILVHLNSGHAQCNHDEGQHSFRVLEEQQDTSIVNLVDEFSLPISDAQKSQLEFGFAETKDNYEYFRLDKKTGEIFTSPGGIDREKICHKVEVCSLNLNVILYKPSSLYKSLSICIQVDDVNDHTPSFNPDSADLSISEDSPLGTTLDLQPASDEDFSLFDVQRYEITSFQSFPTDPDAMQPIKEDDSIFQLVHEKSADYIFPDQLSLKIVGPLDYERINAYKLIIEAFDGQNKTGKLKVHVHVTDVNDNSPVFEKDSYKISINESFPIGKVLLIFKATDKDSGKNSIIRYSFPRNQMSWLQKFFQLNSNTGELSLVKPLNHQEQRQFQFKVLAQDLGDRPKHSATNVHIEVIDINNFEPAISIMPLNQQGNVEIFENEPSFTFVFHLQVSDADSNFNGKVSCFLNDDRENKFFILDKLTEKDYKLVTSNGSTIDREEGSMHEVTITCKDHGIPPLQTTKKVHIQVVDVDDNSPYFKPDLYSFKINENNPLNFVLTQVVAGDKDEGLNSKFRYSLCNPRKDSKFVKVDEDTGVMKSSMSFDYEEIKWLEVCVRVDNECHNCSQQERNINSQSTTSATTKLTIEVLDSNDNEPEFEEDFYNFDIEENSPANVVVGGVKARDLDSNLYNKFDYKLFETKKDFPFEIDSNSGMLRKNKHCVDRELNNEYIFKVYAIDHKNESLYSEAGVRVEVLDLNDNPPEFTSNCTDVEMTLQLDDLTSDPIYVCSMAVIDRDERNNNEVYVETMRVFDVELFSANQSSEALFFQPEALLRLPESLLTDVATVVFNLTTNATDRGDPPLSTLFKHTVRLHLGENFTVNALRLVFSKNTLSPTLMLVIGLIVLGTLVIIIILAVVIRKVGYKKASLNKLSEAPTDNEFSVYESLKKNKHNSNKHNKHNSNKNNPMLHSNLRDKNIFTKNNDSNLRDRNIFTENNGRTDLEKNLMIQNMNINNHKNNANNNNNNNNNNNDNNNGKENNKNIKSDIKNKSSNSFWNTYFKRKPNQTNNNEKLASASKTTTTTDAKNNIYSLVNDNDSPPRRQIFFNPEESVDSPTSGLDQPDYEGPRQKFIIPTMYSTYKPDEAFYNNDARTHLGLQYSDDYMGDDNDGDRHHNDPGDEAKGVGDDGDLEASNDEENQRAYDSYSSMPRHTKLKTFFEADNNTDYDLRNTRTLSNSSSFKNITNTQYYQ